MLAPLLPPPPAHWRGGWCAVYSSHTAHKDRHTHNARVISCGTFTPACTTNTPPGAVHAGHLPEGWDCWLLLLLRCSQKGPDQATSRAAEHPKAGVMDKSPSHAVIPGLGRSQSSIPLFQA